MSDDDLIRRGDALALLADGKQTWGGAVAAIAAMPVVQPDETREYRNGKHLLDTARSLGWSDDGEGAFNFIARTAYTQGALDAQPAPDVAALVGDSFDALIAEARAEAAKAMRKFPQPNYVITKVAEEAGEVVKAAVHCAEGREDPANVRGEMKQLIAMLYRLWVEGDQVHGLAALAAWEARNG